MILGFSGKKCTLAALVLTKNFPWESQEEQMRKFFLLQGSKLDIVDHYNRTLIRDMFFNKHIKLILQSVGENQKDEN